MLSNQFNRDLFIGLDLSFNSSGITFLITENQEATNIDFQLLLFNKRYKKIRGVTQVVYDLPENIKSENLIIDELFEPYTEDQIFITLKYTIAAKNIINIIDKFIENQENKFDNIIVGIEGFIAPQIIGQIQFRNLTGIIMMQGLIRSHLLIKYKNKLKFNIISPSNLKLFFTGKGNADKFDMLQSFIHHFDGEMLIDVQSLIKINDIVDSFALVTNIFYKFYFTERYNLISTQISKLKKKKKKRNNHNNKPINFEQWIIP